MTENNQIEFSLVRISTDQFAVLESNYDPTLAETEFRAEIKYGSIIDQQILAVSCHYTFLQKGNPFLVLITSCHFRVSEAAIEMFRKPDAYIIPKEFAIHLGILTVGTSRGIMHSKTENTIFNRYMIPMINLLELVTTDPRVHIIEAAKEAVPA